MNNTPVALVVYNRPDHTLKVLQSLAGHRVQNLYIFADAPKKPEHNESVAQVRRLIHSIDFCRPVIVERNQNFGLAKSIVAATDLVLSRHDRIILLEDDCVPGPYFFDFINTCLEKYQYNHQIFGISGYGPAIPPQILNQYPYDLYFCPRMGSWGWATWKRAWQHRGTDLKQMLNTAIKRGIDLDQGGTDIPQAIINLFTGKVCDVWTLHWLLTVYLNNGVYIYPTKSHIDNVGMDGTGIHCDATNKWQTQICTSRPDRYPENPFYDETLLKVFRSYYDLPPKVRAAVPIPQKTTLRQNINKLTQPQNPKAQAEKQSLNVGLINTGDMRGGAQRVGLDIKQNLKKRNHTVDMFVRTKHSTDPDVHIITDPAKDAGTKYKQLGYMYYDIQSTFDLIKNPKIQNADLLHFHNLHGEYFNPFALPDLTKLKPSVWTLHDMNSLTGHCAYAFDCDKWQTGCGNCPHPEAYPPITKDQTAQMWADKKRIYAASDYEIIVPSNWLKQIVQKSIHADKPVHLIYNGIDHNIYKPYPKQQIRQKLGIPDDAVVCGFVANGGLNDKRKGGDYLLAAYKYLMPRYSNLYFMCIGGQSRQAPADRFIQVPFIMNENLLAQVYAAADVFLFPTLADNCPLIILELMGCAIPMVSFDIGGVPELIDHNKTGYIAQYKNAEQFVKLTENLILDPAKRNAFAQTAHQKLFSGFTLDHMIENHLKLYHNIIEKRKTAKSAKTSLSIPSTTNQPQTLPAQSAHNTNNKKYLVTALVSTYNSENQIRFCLEDLENQTIAPQMQIVVVDSGSQQNEAAIVREFQKKYNNIKYIRTENRETVYHAWNRAIQASDSEFITNANTDDRHHPQAIEKLIQALQSNPDKPVAYSNYTMVRESQGSRQPVQTIKPGKFSRKLLLDGNCQPGSQPLWRRSLHNEFGLFDPQFFVGGDYEFWLRVSRKYDFAYIDENLGERLITKNAISRSNDDLIETETTLLKLCHLYAANENMLIDATGISENPVFKNWPETNIWKSKVRQKIQSRKIGPSEYIADIYDQRPQSSPSTSVIIITSGNQPGLIKTLQSLNQQNSADFEAVIITTDSLDNIKQLAPSANFPLAAVSLNANMGQAFASNIASTIAQGKYLAFTVEGIEFPHDFIEKTNSAFNQYNIAAYRPAIIPTGQTPAKNPEYNLGPNVIPAPCALDCIAVIEKQSFHNAAGCDQYLTAAHNLEISYRLCKNHPQKTTAILYIPHIAVKYDDAGRTMQTDQQIRTQLMNLIAWRHNNNIAAYNAHLRNYLPGAQPPQNPENVINLASALAQDFPAEALNWLSYAQNLPLTQQQKNQITTLKQKLQPPADTDSQNQQPQTVGDLEIISRAAPKDYLVSAIVSTYNAENFIENCLTDLLNQTITDRLEIIVINSGSTQNEDAIIRKFLKLNDNITYLRTKHREKLYRAWNRAIKFATGKYLTNANTDDRHRPDCLEILAAELEKKSHAALAYADQISTDTPNATWQNHNPLSHEQRAEYSHKRLLFGCCVGSQPMWRKSLHKELGGFDESLDCAADWDFWIRISEKYPFIHVPKLLGIYYHNNEGIEHGRKIHSLYERYIVGRRYGTEYIGVIPYCKPSDDAPLVSVITPAFNAEKHIADTIESVIIQNYPKLEMIIVDDGSTDNTAQIVQKYAQTDTRIKYIHKENAGPSSARNLGIKNSLGQFIFPLDADDMMAPTSIFLHLKEFQNNPDTDLIYSDVLLIEPSGKPIKVMKKKDYQNQNQIIADLFRSGHPAVPFRLGIKKTVFEKIGLYDETLMIAEDYDMICRFIHAGLTCRRLPEPLHLRRMQKGTLSNSTTDAKAQNHFNVMRRIVQTFSCEQLFPEVEWSRMHLNQRQIYENYLIANVYIQIAQSYISSSQPVMARHAFDAARSHLITCQNQSPQNPDIQNLLNQCQQAVQMT